MSTIPPQPLHAAVETSGVIPALPGSDDNPGRGPAVRSLFTGLVDDAAVFPPGLAPMPEAVPSHLVHTGAWYADLVGPFLVPASAVGAFAGAVAALPDGTSLRVAVVADATAPDPLPGALEALAAVAALPVVEPVALEVPLARGADQDAEAAALLPRLAALPSGVRAWVEVQRDRQWHGALSRIAGAGDDVGAKLRTGGTTAQAFPSTRELAEFLRAAVDTDVVFKLTAGLHSAVRGPDAATGADHHGVLNVIGAVRAALNGAETPEVETVLAETSPARLASAARRMSEADAAVVRAFFASFGCCGVTDPVAELAALGLLAERPA
jgi:hypothetical protein